MFLVAKPGATLADEMTQCPLSPARVSTIAHDVLAELTSAHEAGAVHSGITPASIRLTDDGHAEITDFGVANVRAPAYIAPERLRGETATPASDVFAVGVVLYEALTGEHPFTGETPMAVANAVISTSPPPLRAVCPDLDRALIGAVDCAMEKDVAWRLPTAAAMLARIDGDASPVIALSSSTKPAIKAKDGATGRKNRLRRTRSVRTLTSCAFPGLVNDSVSLLHSSALRLG